MINFSKVNALKNNSTPFKVRASPIKAAEKPHAPAVSPEAAVQSVLDGNVATEKMSGQAGGSSFFLCHAVQESLICFPLLHSDISCYFQ